MTLIKLKVNLMDRGYPIYISTDFTGLGRAFNSADVDGKVVVITDDNVDNLYSKQCIECSGICDGDIYKYIIPAGEKNKNLDTVRDIYKYLISLKLDRNSTLVALGGGVVGDITGFAAATFLRGINFIQIPASLLAQADSSVGGKVGVDFEGSKNIIGSFYQPKFVYINVSLLKTLPPEEIQAGIAETIKHGLIRDADFYEYVDCNINRIYKFDVDVLQYITKLNCLIKGKVVEEDEKEENGQRVILNFGHTFGHAIESVLNFRVSHGNCVSLGIVCAYKMAMYMDMVGEQEVLQVTNTLQKAGLPIDISGVDVEAVYNQMLYDKKIKKDKLLFILPKKIGEVIQCTVNDKEIVKKVLSEIITT